MRILLYTALFGTLALAGPAWLQSRSLLDSDISSILSNVKGGVLVKNGKITSCELGVVDNRGAVVNSDCLDYDGSGNVDTSTTYEIYLDSGSDGKAVKYPLSKYQLVSNSTSSLANNYAYLFYNSDATLTWQNTMAPVLNYNWDDVVFVRRSLLNTTTMKWSTPEFVSGTKNYDYTCSSMSDLFQRNTAYYLCNNFLTEPPSSDLDSCSLPYGTVYGILNRKAHLLGIFSYSLVKGGSDMCKSSEQRSYYSALYKYMNHLLLSENWGLDVNQQLFKESGITFDQNYAIDQSTDTALGTGIMALRGDFYKDQKSQITYPSSSSSDSPSGSSGESSDSTDSSNDGKSSHSAVIIGVCVGVGGVLLLCGLGFGVYWWRRRAKSVDPISQTGYQDMLESELGGPTVTHRIPRAHEQAMPSYDLPPVYDSPTVHADNSNSAPATEHASTDNKEKS